MSFSDTLLTSIETNILNRYYFLKNKILPPPSLQNKNLKMLKAVAHSDGNLINVFKRARLTRSEGYACYNNLNRVGILYKEYPREQKNEKFNISYEKRGRKNYKNRYKAQSKIKFSHPFYRFWFNYIEPHSKKIEKNDYSDFYKDINSTFDRYVSFTFEDLSNALIKYAFKELDPVAEKGNYWDRCNEFDLMAKTKKDKIIVGECKWRGHKICKNQISKLKLKCERSGLKPDFLALFSKSGFSNELKSTNDPNILCFELKDFERLLA